MSHFQKIEQDNKGNACFRNFRRPNKVTAFFMSEVRTLTNKTIDPLTLILLVETLIKLKDLSNIK